MLSKNPSGRMLMGLAMYRRRYSGCLRCVWCVRFSSSPLGPNKVTEERKRGNGAGGMFLSYIMSGIFLQVRAQAQLCSDLGNMDVRCCRSTTPFMCEDSPLAGAPVAVSGAVTPLIGTATFPFLLLKFSTSSFPSILPNFT